MDDLMRQMRAEAGNTADPKLRTLLQRTAAEITRLKAVIAAKDAAVESAWQEIRENLNRLHSEGAITCGELKHGVNMAALMRDAALREATQTGGEDERRDALDDADDDDLQAWLESR